MLGRKREIGERLSKLIHTTVKNCLCNKVFQGQGIQRLGGVADEAEEVSGIFLGIYEGGSSDYPGRLCLDVADAVVELSLVTEILVSLVEADPGEGTVEQGGFVEALVVGDVDGTGFGYRAVDLFPVALFGEEDRKSTAKKVAFPLGNQGLGAEEESVRVGGICNEAEDLLAFSQPHFIA